MKRIRLLAAPVTALVALGLVASACSSTPGGGGGGGSTPGGGGTVKLLETGSTLLYPLFNLWVPAYQQATTSVQITTAGTGSGTGIAEATSGAAQIGASDAYLAPAIVQQTPTMENIPLAISAQQVNYNLPGLNSKHLNLSGAVLAGIYSGKIRYWDDPAIKALNPGLALPHKGIVPVHRADGSGDSFLFTSYLSDTTPSWSKSVGFSTTPNWPSVPSAIGANGNSGMVQALQQTPYAIAYVGISYLDQTDKAGLGYAALQNRDGKFVLPSSDTIKAAAAASAGNVPASGAVSLILSPGATSYPIINYEYAIVNTKQSDPAVASAIKAFLTWCITQGNAATFLDQVHFQPLPSNTVQLSQQLISKIGS